MLTNMSVAIKDILFIRWVGMGADSRKPITMLDVINWGIKVGGDSLKFNTKNGEQVKEISELTDSYVNCIEPSEVNVVDSLHYWYKKHPEQINKLLVYDEKLKDGETYVAYCWIVGILLLPTENEIRYKFIF